MVLYDYSKLRGRIVEKYGTVSKFADVLGLSLVSVSNKLNNKTGFTRGDIEKWSQALCIPDYEYGTYYFARKV